jgi:ribonuclease P protein component
MSDARFPKASRLLRTRDFERVFEARQSRGDRLLIVYGRPNDLGTTRLGLVVSRKCGGAVRRNRWKRLLREAFRRRRQDLPLAYDLVVIARPPAEPDLGSLENSLLRLAHQVARRPTAGQHRSPGADRGAPSA